MDQICERVKQLFAWLCETPHPSGAECALVQRLKTRLEELGGDTWKDEAGNLICDFPASPGQQDAPVTALQAHVDMVCAVGARDYIPARDPVVPIARDGWIGTDGRSSLGADCGAGMAVMLWLAEHMERPHPPLRLIFTVEEETGLVGARRMDPEAVSGVRYLINTDGFHWGRVVVGSAGGVRERYCRPLSWSPAPKLPNGRAYRLTWTGMRGGHSGFDMGKHRANAVLLMGELLRELRMESPFALAGFTGGTAFNAIPYTATAEVLTIAPADDAIREIAAQIAARWKEHEPDVHLLLEEIELPNRVWDGDVASGLLTVLGGFADGVYAMHPEIKHAVCDSSNLGSVYADEQRVCLDAMLRCMDAQAEQALHMSHRAVCGMCGFSGEIVSRYPAWAHHAAGKLCEDVVWAYHTVTGQQPEVTIQHVGLEPSWFLEKNPDMECVCVGMEIMDCHSPRERWKLDTIAPFAKMLCKLLERLCV